MAKILIDIPKEMHKALEQGSFGAKYNMYDLVGVVMNGTPLPKGHGRLIDADKIIYHRCPDNVLDCPQSYDFTCQHCGIATKFRTDAIPAIIEADEDGE